MYSPEEEIPLTHDQIVCSVQYFYDYICDYKEDVQEKMKINELSIERKNLGDFEKEMAQDENKYYSNIENLLEDMQSNYSEIFESILQWRRLK